MFVTSSFLLLVRPGAPSSVLVPSSVCFTRFRKLRAHKVGSHRFSETDPFRPGNPYSASKELAEHFSGPCLVRRTKEAWASHGFA